MTPITDSFQMTRTLATDPQTLWHLLTDAKSRETWSAPDDDHTLETDAADLRVGGRDSHRCGPKEEPYFIVDTHWYHLAAPALACFTETLRIGGETMGVTLVSYAVTLTDTGCTLQVDVAVTSLNDEAAPAEFKAGWTSALTRLAKIIDAGADN